MTATGPALAPGEIVPGTKYRIVKALGAGGMGVVYQVVKPPDIQGVLKLMSSELAAHEEHRMRFFDEVRILARLEHPNIVRVFDYDSLPDGSPFYVMEMLTGRTVRDALETMRTLAPRVAYEITRQLLEALQCAHTHEVPVIHRDIKPENIFLHAPRHGDPVVKLIDFGVSSVADRQHDGSFVGTWAYAAPEQIRGEIPTPATDLYAVGLVLYEMLAGVGPFDHHTEWAKISDAQMRETPAPVSKFAPWVPPSIVRLIAAALAKDPRQRPRDAYEFAERLFELEWASEGKDPHDRTAEGRATPIAKVLDTLTGVPPAPAAKREPTAAPDTSDLLAGLSAPNRKPPSKRERASDPDLAASPRPGQIVIRTGEEKDAPREVHGPTTPRAMPVGRGAGVTLEENLAPAVTPGAPAVAPRDTFASQATDKPKARPTPPLVLWLGAGITLAALGLAALGVLFRPPQPTPNTVATEAPPRESAPVPPLSAAPKASAPPTSAAPKTSAPPTSAAPKTSAAPADVSSATGPRSPRTPPSAPRTAPVAQPSGRSDYMQLIP